MEWETNFTFVALFFGDVWANGNWGYLETGQPRVEIYLFLQICTEKSGFQSIQEKSKCHEKMEYIWGDFVPELSSMKYFLSKLWNEGCNLW